MIIKDGDYFSYTWKVGKGPKSDPYWCRDGRAVARTDINGDIWLIDTYNYWPYKDSVEDKNIFTHDGLAREYSKYIDVGRFDLEFICNLNDYEFIHEYAKDDYEGVVFVGYQCTKKWAKPKGSSVSKAAVLKKLEAQLQRAHEDLRSAEWTITRINEQIEEFK